MGFVHLHVHGPGSLLDAPVTAGGLVARAGALGMDAIALTDHGAMFGAVSFYQEARRAGIRPILGCELYVAPGPREARETDEHGRAHYHLVVLARSVEGYRNLCRLVTAGHLEGFYYKPRVDKALLRECREGLIGLSACVKGEIASAVLREAPEAEVRRVTEEYVAIFGEGNFFLEVQEAGLPEQRVVRDAFLDLGARWGIPVVATNDCHYLTPEDAVVQEVLLCLQTGKTMDDPSRMRLGGEGFWVCPEEEMHRRFGGDPAGIVSRTAEIAARCEVELPLGKMRLPEVPDAAKTLRERAREGLIERLRKRPYRDEREKRATWHAYRTRLEEELETIGAMGFAGYFLIVADFVGWAKAQGVPVGPGRGSAAGSLVSYALGITDLDPLRYELLFERFLNPERVSMPDIDVDFCPEHRDRVLAYVAERYGAERIAQITTVGRWVGRGAVRDVGRVLGMPLSRVDEIARLIPEEPGATVSGAMENVEALAAEAKGDPQVRTLLDLARRLEGVARHASIHAAGVVIATNPLGEDVPLYRGKDGEVVTQYDMGELEALGYVKFDFLGLRTLTLLDRAARWVREGVDPAFSLEGIPLEDPEVYAMLSAGETGGVFQLESAGMRDLLRRLVPERFEDLIAVMALYRPGPLGSGLVDQYVERRHGREPVKVELPAVEPILRETYGVLLYQEQVMQVAREVAGYSLGEADILRRAMGKKKADVMASHRKTFVQGAVERGVDPQVAEGLFDQMEKFAAYGFNKSHAAAYALVAYQTAFLRRHYPREFFAALLSTECGDTDKLARYVADARRSGVPVLPPDVNVSGVDFLPVDDGVRFGLQAIKNVGRGAAEAIVEEREAAGSFASLDAFFARMASRREVTRRVVESLVDAGALDGLDPRREQVVETLDRRWNRAAQQAKAQAKGQQVLWGAGVEEPGEEEEAQAPCLGEEARMRRWAREKAVVGCYVTGHPLEGWEERLWQETDLELGDVVDLEAGQVWVGGHWAEIRRRRTRRGLPMAVGVLEDIKGDRLEVLVFPAVLARDGAALTEHAVALVCGASERRGERRAVLHADRMVDLRSWERRAVRPPRLVIHVREGVHDPSVLRRIAAAWKRHRVPEGPVRGMVVVHRGDGSVLSVLRMGTEYRLDARNEALETELKAVLGHGGWVEWKGADPDDGVSAGAEERRAAAGAR